MRDDRFVCCVSFEYADTIGKIWSATEKKLFAAMKTMKKLSRLFSVRFLFYILIIDPLRESSSAKGLQIGGLRSWFCSLRSLISKSDTLNARVMC